LHILRERQLVLGVDSAHRRGFTVKRILPIVMAGMMGAGMVAAQTSTSAQAGTSTQSQTSVQTSKSGAQASSNGSASTSSAASANAGKNSADISNATSSSASANASKSSAGSSKSASSSTSSNAGKNSGEISDGTKIDATLTNSLDAKKNKAGDRVEAVATHDVKQDGKVVVKKGTRLVGHVTESQARTKEQAQSQLGIVFDHAMTAKGQEIPLNATIQALAAAQSSVNAGDDAMPSAGGMGAMSGAARGGSGLVGGVASTAGAGAGTVMNTAGSAPVNAGGTLGAASHSTGAVGGLTSTGRLASNSNGVFGLDGLSLNSAANSATQGSMIVSPTKNVHLDSGTQMLLSATSQAQAK